MRHQIPLFPSKKPKNWAWPCSGFEAIKVFEDCFRVV